MFSFSRFLEVPYYSIDKATADSIGDENCEPELRRMKLCVDEIESYEQATLNNKNITNKKAVYIGLKSGVGHTCAISFSDFENMLSDFDNFADFVLQAMNDKK